MSDYEPSFIDGKWTILQQLMAVRKFLKTHEDDIVKGRIQSISVINIDETHIKLKFTYKDGSITESDSITLPRGEKGENGKGFGDAIGILAPTGLNYTITYDTTNGLVITGLFSIRTGIDEVFDIPIAFTIPIIAGDGVTIGADETNKYLVIKSKVYQHRIKILPENDVPPLNIEFFSSKSEQYTYNEFIEKFVSNDVKDTYFICYSDGDPNEHTVSRAWITEVNNKPAFFAEGKYYTNPEPISGINYLSLTEM